MSLIAEIKVVPQSGKNEWVLDKSGKLKCYLKSPPERGLANKELIKILAQKLGVTQNAVELISGHTSRNKRVKIEGVASMEHLIALLGIERQQNIF
ncbi:DUF167 domain-containing protein [Candidatus Dependentiae bacterium]|nr:DUF167 domain-containing protein [Candidatus Dependentiae bacterium]